MDRLERWLRGWLQPVEIIYRRELAHSVAQMPARIQRMFGTLGFVALLVVALYSALTAGVMASVARLIAIPVVALPLLIVYWRVQVVIAATGVIAREVEGETWELLRVTPATVKEMVLSKYAAALVRAGRNLVMTFTVRVMFGISTVCLLAHTLTIFINAARVSDEGVWTVVMLVASVGYLCVEPLIDFLTDGALGLLVSAASRDSGRALRVGFLMSAFMLVSQFALTLWLIGALASAMIGWNVAPLLWSSPVEALWWLLAWGPAGAMFFGVGPVACLLVLGIVLLLRCLFLRGLLFLAVRRAEAISR